MRASSSLLVLLLTAASAVVVLPSCKAQSGGGGDDGWRPSGIDAGIFGGSPLQAAKKASQAEMDKHKLEKMQLGFVRDAEQACKVDADCVLTTRYCCGCAANGAMVGVRSDELQNVLYRRVVGCKDYACAQVMSSDPSCEASKAVCRQSKCVPDAAPAAPGKAPAGLGVEPIPDDGKPAPAPKPQPQPASPG